MSPDDLARAFYEAQQDTMQMEYRTPWDNALEQTREQIRRWCRVALSRAQCPVHAPLNDQERMIEQRKELEAESDALLARVGELERERDGAQLKYIRLVDATHQNPLPITDGQAAPVAIAIRDAWDESTLEPDSSATPEDLARRLGEFSRDWMGLAKKAEAERDSMRAALVEISIGHLSGNEQSDLARKALSGTVTP